MADCTLPTLTENSKCLGCLSQSQKQAAKVAFLALALKAAGGTDLTNVNTLRSAAVCYNCEPEPTLDTFDTLIAKNLALQFGAADLTVNQIMDVIKCYCGIDLKELHAMETLLRCQLTAKAS